MLDFDPGQSKAKAYAIDWGEEFVGRLDHGPAHWGRSEYVAACTTLGRRITWEPDGAGMALDVAEDGSLVVDSSGDMVHLTRSEVRHVRAAAKRDEPSPSQVFVPLPAARAPNGRGRSR